MFRALLLKNFPEDVRQLFQYNEEVESPPKAYIFTIPQEETVFDYKYIKEVGCMIFSNDLVLLRHLLVQGKGKWKLWQDEIISTSLPRDIPVNQIIITTVETVRNMAIMRLLVSHQKALMFVGPTGTGKSVNVIVCFCIFFYLR